MRKITINPISRPMVFIYDGVFHDNNFDSWLHALTVEEAINIMEMDMRIHNFYSAVAVDGETGEILIEIENKGD